VVAEVELARAAGLVQFAIDGIPHLAFSSLFFFVLPNNTIDGTEATNHFFSSPK
jgi:hypothetical protein